MRRNETHVVTGVDGKILVLTSADPREFETRITRDDLGKTLAWSSSENLVAIGMMVVLCGDKWEAATLNRE